MQRSNTLRKKISWDFNIADDRNDFFRGMIFINLAGIQFRGSSNFERKSQEILVFFSFKTEGVEPKKLH